ncbi:MAG TPA: glycosyltransferase [Rhodanobacteraceae bacterium]|nr:glycosyltransferase [Rhodanobacteraceae bacterium]
MTTPPRVTIVIATYNAAGTLAETLASVAAQTYTDFELVVIDDGSSDDTPALLARHQAAWPWLRWAQQENAGASAARMRAVAMARGEFIAFLDSDDLWLPDKLALQMAVFDRNPSTALVFTDERDFSADGDAALSRFQQKQPARGRVLSSLFFGNYILNSTVVVRKDALLAAGGLNPSQRVHEGIDLWLRLAEQHDFDYVDKVLVRYRVRPDSISHVDLLACQQRDLEIMDYWMARRPDLFAADSPGVLRRRAEILERIGRTLLSRGDYRGSRTAYRQAIRLGNHDAGVLLRATAAHLPPLAKIVRRLKPAKEPARTG